MGVPNCSASSSRICNSNSGTNQLSVKAAKRLMVVQLEHRSTAGRAAGNAVFGKAG